MTTVRSSDAFTPRELSGYRAPTRKAGTSGATGMICVWLCLARRTMAPLAPA
jgi:hypothetical protein